MPDKDQVARSIAQAHFKLEPTILGIFRITTSDESNPCEPIKLLEVNPDTPAAGIIPIAFGATERVPYPSVVVEITPDEFDMIRSRQLELPDGWRVGESLLEGAGVVLDGGR